MTLLPGKAIDWAAVVWEADLMFKTSYDYFVSYEMCLNIPLGAGIYQHNYFRCLRVTVLLHSMPLNSGHSRLRVGGTMFH